MTANEETSFDGPLVIDVAQMPEDELVRAHAEQLIRFAGSMATEAVVGTDSKKQRFASLAEAIRAAGSNDTARQFVTANARADVVERTIKAGHVTEVPLEVDEYGRIRQYGQLMTEVYVNALRYGVDVPQIRARTETETHNGLRMDGLRRQGLLDEYYFVIFSCCPDDMADADAEAAGYYMGTKTYAIQTVSQVSGMLMQQSAFVAGVAAEGGPRHDTAATAALFADFGIQLGDSSATELLGRPLLIHKTLMPNGVVDLVERYDRLAGGLFFGQTKLTQDYLRYLELCREREQEFEPTVQVIVGQLLAEADSIQTPLAAVRRLHELSQDATVMRAFADTVIDPLVFGATAAQHIEEGRAWLEQGDTLRFLEARSEALDTARSFSCPTAFIEAQRQQAWDNAQAPEARQSAATPTGKRERMTCPFCKDPGQSGDPCSPDQHCNNCDARVKDGRIVSRGNHVAGSSLGQIATHILINRRSKTSAKHALVA